MIFKNLAARGALALGLVAAAPAVAAEHVRASWYGGARRKTQRPCGGRLPLQSTRDDVRPSQPAIRDAPARRLARALCRGACVRSRTRAENRTGARSVASAPLTPLA